MTQWRTVQSATRDCGATRVPGFVPSDSLDVRTSYARDNSPGARGRVTVAYSYRPLVPPGSPRSRRSDRKARGADDLPPTHIRLTLLGVWLCEIDGYIVRSGARRTTD